MTAHAPLVAAKRSIILIRMHEPLFNEDVLH